MIATKGTPDLKNANRVSPELHNFLYRCLVVDVAKRAEISELLKVRAHQLGLAVSSRITIEQHPFIMRASALSTLTPVVEATVRWKAELAQESDEDFAQ
jgi:serine/threonine protein kinase